MSDLMQGVYTDENGLSSIIPIAIDATGRITGAIPPSIVPVVNFQIATGGVSQKIFGAAPTCTYLEIANYSDGDLWVQFDGSAGINNGFKIGANQPNWRSPTQLSVQLSIYIFGATTGQKFAVLTN